MLNNVHPNWKMFFDRDDIAKLLEQCIINFCKIDLDEICPSFENILNFARYTDPHNLVGCIIGQDPYIKRNEACGMSFSNFNPSLLRVDIPPSLKAIYKSLLNFKHIDKMPDHGCLYNWAHQGILLLNANLTTIVGKSKAHSFWKAFTAAILKFICEKNPKIIFMLWGGDAQKLESEIAVPKIQILKWSHPSPMADNSQTDELKFINNDHFGKFNLLATRPINWGVSSNTMVYTDGSCDRNGMADASAGYSVVFTGGPFKGKVIYGNVPQVADAYKTSIRAEMMGLIIALKYIYKYEPIGPIMVITDSEFCYKLYNQWVEKWFDKSGNVVKKDMKNQDLCKLFLSYKLGFSQRMHFGNLVVAHVNGHVGIEGNEIADKYAKKGKYITHENEITELYC